MAESVEFGDCVVHIALRTIQRDGKSVSVPPLVFDCIAYLIQHRNRAVGRDELVSAVWGKVDVSDAALAKTILTARRAIGDDGESQRFLRTVPRFGYRWTADTRMIDIPEPERRASSEATLKAGADTTFRPDIPPTGHRVRRLIWIALAALALATASLFAWRHRSPEADDARAGGDRPAGVIGVLPADVVSASEDSWLRLGLMDMIATRLGGAGLPVLPSDNMVRWVPVGTGRDAAMATLRRVTERSGLVAPSVRRSGQEWIVRAELIGADGDTRAVQAQSDNVIAAAGEVSNRLLELLGRPTLGKATNGAGLSEAELLQRIDAARLAHQPEQAQTLITAAAPPLQKSPVVRLRKAQIALDLGQSEPAREQLAALAAQVSAEADASLLASVQRSLCIASSQLGRVEEALHACDEAIRLLEGRGTPSELARTYNNRGIVHLMRQQYDLAGQDFSRAKIAANLAVDALLIAQIEGNESSMQSLQGHFAEVAVTQQRIGRRFEQFGMIDEYVKSLINQSTAWISLLHPMEALETSSLAMAELPRVEHAGTRLQGYLVRANALELSGRLGDARVLLDRTVLEASDASLAIDLGIARASQARIELASAAPDAALVPARQALDNLQSPAVSVHRAGAWMSLVRSLDALHRIDEARTEAQAFSAWAAQADDLSVTLYARLAVAEQAAAANRAQEADSAYQAALDMARRWSVPDLLREVVASYGRFLLAQGDLPRASAIIGQVSSYAETDFEAALMQARLYHALNQEPAAAAALAQARRLAGEREIPPELSSAAPLVAPRSSSGNAADMDAQ